MNIKDSIAYAPTNHRSLFVEAITDNRLPKISGSCSTWPICCLEDTSTAPAKLPSDIDN